MPDLWEHECAAWAQGYETVCGVDEAGARAADGRSMRRRSSCRAAA